MAHNGQQPHPWLDFDKAGTSEGKSLMSKEPDGQACARGRLGVKPGGKEKREKG